MQSVNVLTDSRRTKRPTVPTRAVNRVLNFHHPFRPLWAGQRQRWAYHETGASSYSMSAFSFFTIRLSARTSVRTVSPTKNRIVSSMSRAETSSLMTIAFTTSQSFICSFPAGRPTKASGLFASLKADAWSCKNGHPLSVFQGDR